MSRRHFLGLLAAAVVTPVPEPPRPVTIAVRRLRPIHKEIGGVAFVEYQWVPEEVVVCGWQGVAKWAGIARRLTLFP